MSPDDLLAACKLCEEMNLKLKLRKFDKSGVIVIELTDLNYDLLVNKVEMLAVNRFAAFASANRQGFASGGLLPSHVSTTLKMSLMIANEILLYAEKRGYLCRDEGTHGIEFYPNLFNDYSIK